MNGSICFTLPPRPFCSVDMEYDSMSDTKTLRVTYRASDQPSDVVSNIAYLLGVADPSGSGDDPQPAIRKVIFNGGATIVFWNDGSKTVAKCHGGDKFDPLFGIMACAARKLTHNHGHGVDDNEPIIADLAKRIKSTDDIDELIEDCLRRLDLLTVLADSADLWMDQLGPACEPERDSHCDAHVANPVVSSRMDELESRLEDLVREREAMRQKIRDLVDAGEL